jgi:hypothetical protein
MNNEKLTVKELAAIGITKDTDASTLTLDQVRALMKLLGLKEKPDEYISIPNKCSHYKEFKPGLPTEHVKDKLTWPRYMKMLFEDNKTCVAHVLSRRIEDDHVCDLTDRDCPFEGRKTGKKSCELPEFAKKNVQVSDEVLDIIGDLVGCTGCECMAKHWYLSECEDCCAVMGHLKAYHLLKRAKC